MTLKTKRLFTQDDDASYNHHTRQQYYKLRILQKMIRRFTIEGLDIEKCNNTDFFIAKHLNGHIAIDKNKNVLVGNFTGKLLPNGFGDRYQGSNWSGKPFNYKVGKDVIVIPNNRLFMDDNYFIDRYARMKGLIDESLVIQLLASRDTPVIACSSDAEAEQYKLAQEKRKNGDLAVIVKQNALIDTIGVKAESNNLLTPSGNNVVESLAMLCQFQDEITARLMRELGLSITNKDKKAQVQTSELDAYDDYVLIGLLDEYEALKEAIDKANELFEYDEPLKLIVNDPFHDVIFPPKEEEIVEKEEEQIVEPEEGEGESNND